MNNLNKNVYYIVNSVKNIKDIKFPSYIIKNILIDDENFEELGSQYSICLKYKDVKKFKEWIDSNENIDSYWNEEDEEVYCKN